MAEDPCLDTAKLIPSRELEEKRKAFVPPEADYTTKIGLCGSLVSRKKKKELFKSKQVKRTNAKKNCKTKYVCD